MMKKTLLFILAVLIVWSVISYFRQNPQTMSPSEQSAAVSNAVADIDPEEGRYCLDLLNNLRYRTTDSQSGGEVSALQDFLISGGYLNATATGFFGPLTLAAVKKFQESNGIVNTGYVGPLTRDKILEISCGSDVGAETSASSKQPLPKWAEGNDIVVTSPAEGDILYAGKTYQIRWSTRNILYAEDMKIMLLNRNAAELSKIGSQYRQGTTTAAGASGQFIKSSLSNLPDLIENTGYYNWVVPSGIPSGSSYYVEVGKAKAGGESARSQTFKIVSSGIISGNTQSKAPLVSSVSDGTSILTPGTESRLSGQNLIGIINIYLVPENDTEKIYVGWSKETGTSVIVDVSMKPPLVNGNYNLYVSSQWGRSGAFPVKVASTPYVVSTDGQYVIAGGRIGVKGFNFSQDSLIIVDGDTDNPLPALSVSATSLEFRVPTNMSSGKHTVQVMSKKGGVLSNSATVEIASISDIPAPVISSVIPEAGKADDIVTVTGSGFVARSDITTVKFYLNNVWYGTMYPSYISADGTTLKFVVNKTFVEKTNAGTYQIRVSNTVNESNIFNFTIVK